MLQKFILYILVLYLLLHLVLATTRKTVNTANFKKVLCETNPEYFFNHSCNTRLINRHDSRIDLNAMPIKPLKRMFMEIQLYKRMNGWKPVLLRASFSFCKFLSGTQVPVMKVFRRVIQKYTNFNHTCPYRAYEPIYGRNISVDVLSLGESTFPGGSYRASVKAYEAKNVFIGSYDIFVDVEEKEV